MASESRQPPKQVERELSKVIRFAIDESEIKMTNLPSTEGAASSRSATGPVVTNRRSDHTGDHADKEVSERVLLAVKVFFGVIFFSLVLVCTVCSKLSLVNLTDQLRSFTRCNETRSNCSVQITQAGTRNLAVTTYWQLSFVIIIPTLLTFLRTLVFGVLGKTTKMYPWPRLWSGIGGALVSIVEVIAITVFVFLVAAELPASLTLLLLNGVFIFQIFIDFCHSSSCCCCGQECSQCVRGNYATVAGRNDAEGRTHPLRTEKLKKVKQVINFFETLLENRTVKSIAFLLQLCAVMFLIPVWVYLMRTSYMYKVRTMVALPLSLLALSVIWSNKVQEWIARPDNTIIYTDTKRTARYKSSFINSFVRLVFYPFITYIVFRYFTAHHVDPWCLSDLDCTIDLQGNTLVVFLIQLFTSLFAYVFAWVACTMTLSPYSMAFPLLASTPVSLALYYLLNAAILPNVNFFMDFDFEDELWGGIFYNANCYALPIASLLWLGQMLGLGFYILTKRNIILSKDPEMFLTPHYDGVFLEQQMILNRQTNKSNERRTMSGNTIQRQPRTIFICSTMYRENEIEMKQMLLSISRVAENFERSKSDNPNLCDTYESHIFFDGAINGTQLQEYGLQLLSLLPETLNVKREHCIKKRTPYGFSLSWSLGLTGVMPFCIHFKDKNLVKPKKRWSQVMYMNYVINYRIRNDPRLTPKNTYILTTDADIEFTAQSAVVLLDMLESNDEVGAVCARTHPKGSGPLYWYQIFDYAIGHWFQKPAEHMLGCVLCSPGCFSVFRCSALEMVIEEYSTLATTGMEFLMKDMGEDRWLCTLLIKKGWRLEYCAISEDQTFCPVDFAEFYGQRRRWIPSTIANLSMLITEAASITKGNNTVSILFILFQGVMIFSTAISPATVILVISSGLQSAYKISEDGTFFIILSLVFVSIFYGFVCIFASPKAQTDVAKLLTFLFAIIMTIVIAGIFKDTINSIFKDPEKTFLTVPNCTLLYKVNHTENFDNCNKLAKYINSLPNTKDNDKFMLTVSTSVLYLGAFAFTFLVAAILHFREWTCLLHCIWYLLALPSGYLLLLIYSAANLDNETWGTREAGNSEDKGLLGWGRHLKRAWNVLVSCCVRLKCCKPEKVESSKEEQGVEVLQHDKPTLKTSSSDHVDDEHSVHHTSSQVVHSQMDAESREWLEGLECEHYIPNFERNGYTNIHFISSMSDKDFVEIGIVRRGFKLRLSKAAKKLPSLPIQVDVPSDVREWLNDLELAEYVHLFHSEGYRTSADVENLKKLKESDLQEIGITKRAHLQRLAKALNNLTYPKEVEMKMHRTKGIIENIIATNIDEVEGHFWETLIFQKLKPLSVQLTSVKEVRESLHQLRNSMLAVLFLVNVMWIVLLYTVQFPRLADYGIDPRAFQLLFLAVYGFIIVVQFFMMICHRGITLVHYFGRITPVQVIVPSNARGFDNVSMANLNSKI